MFLVVLEHVLPHELGLLQFAVVTSLLRVLVEAGAAEATQVVRVGEAGWEGGRWVVHHLKGGKFYV